MATAPGAPAPATRSPRNAMFPVMKAEKTLPRARKLIASTAPDETVNALSSRSRILTSTVPLSTRAIGRVTSTPLTRFNADDRRLVRRYRRKYGFVDVQVGPH